MNAVRKHLSAKGGRLAAAPAAMASAWVTDVPQGAESALASDRRCLIPRRWRAAA
jgi:glycerate-2-kinase